MIFDYRSRGMDPEAIATPTFRRLEFDYGWVVWGAVDRVHVGDITVTMRDGSTKTVRIDRVGRPFDCEGIQCCYGWLAPEQPKSPQENAS